MLEEREIQIEKGNALLEDVANGHVHQIVCCFCPHCVLTTRSDDRRGEEGGGATIDGGGRRQTIERRRRVREVPHVGTTKC